MSEFEVIDDSNAGSSISGVLGQNSNENEVHILFNGYSGVDPRNPDVFIANCTCTLIKALYRYLNIIVDTMTPWDGPKIIEALKKHSIKPEDISVVVSTHGHSDHTGNNNLFLNAKYHIVGQCIMRKDEFTIHHPWTPFDLSSSIRVIATEGHTLSCVSVVVENTEHGTVVICGDLFEKKQDIENSKIWKDVGSENEKAQYKNRSIVADMADMIVPGHGEMFKVSQEMRQILANQFKNNE